MRSSTLLYTVFNLVACTHASFENTSPLLAFCSKLEGDNYKYIRSSIESQKLISELTSNICESSSSEKLLYLKVDSLDSTQVTYDLLNSFSRKLSKLADHVVYPEYEDLLSASEIPSNCDSVQYLETSGKADSEWLSQLSDSDSQVTVVHLTQDISLAEQLEKISAVYQPENIIIQGLPSFTKAESFVTLASEKFKNFMGLQKMRRHEDSSTDDEEPDYDKIEQELKDTFAEVNELLNDETVTIFADDVSSSYVASSSSNSSVADPNSVFDSYGFFSTGIWMCGIVSFFLIWVLITSLGWLNSLQVSYKAFEKQVSSSKKLQ